MDKKTGSVRNGNKLGMNHLDIHLVLGLPHLGDDVAVTASCTQKDIDRVNSILMIGCGRGPTLEYLEHLLLREYAGKMNSRLRLFYLWMLISCALFFVLRRGG
uniref:Uncharacterized protein n=1 Tax=Arundo donax TaxID=35708 RepID=A0A0A8XZV3_ARUDO